MFINLISKARDGIDALKLFQVHKPILVISDLRMPRMNGIELLRRLKELDKTVHIILISGAADRREIIAAMKEAVFDFLLKPINLDDLIRIARLAMQKTIDTVKSQAPKGKGRLALMEHHQYSEIDGHAILYLNQDMDQYTSLNYLKELRTLLNANTLNPDVVAYLNNVHYINSAGLNLLLQYQDEIVRAGKRLHLCSLSGAVELYIKSLGYLSQFDIVKSLDDLKKRRP